jgi:mannose-1-phosphate guanylyltransferase
MKAMILAAGLGTRLHPLTDDRPKALVTVAGHTLLEIALARLRGFGVREVIVNVHHFAEMVVDYLKSNDNFSMRIEVSRENVLLDTGGGLKRAAWFFLADSETAHEPFLLHNVDVISTIDLGRMVKFHIEEEALATLAVQQRKTTRALLFDKQERLCGRSVAKGGNAEWAWPCDDAQGLAFSGIHVLSPRIFAELTEDGPFSIIDAYMRLAAQGEKVVGFRADESYWRDLGRPESLVDAERDLADGKHLIQFSNIAGDN